MNDELYDWMVENAHDWAIKKLEGERSDAARGWRELRNAEAQLEAALATIARVQDAVDCAPLDNEAAGVFAHILKGGKVRWVEVMYD